MPSRSASDGGRVADDDTAIGMISTSRTNCSRMLSRRMKWVGMPIGQPVIRNSLIRLLRTPLPVIVPRSGC
jgi:hypothetical protein